MPDVLTRETLLGRRLSTVVEVPELGGGIVVRAMTAEGVWAWQDAYQDEDARKRGLPHAMLVIHGAVNPDHSAMFRPEEAEAVLAMPFAVLDRIARAVLKVSGLDAESQAARAGN